MNFRITVAEKDIAFDCAPDETVLDATERAGYAIPYSCRKGVCSSCAGDLVSGQAAVRGQGICTGPMSGVLLCQARPQSDLEISPIRSGRRRLSNARSSRPRCERSNGQHPMSP